MFFRLEHTDEIVKREGKGRMDKGESEKAHLREPTFKKWECQATALK